MAYSARETWRGIGGRRGGRPRGSNIGPGPQWRPYRNTNFVGYRQQQQRASFGGRNEQRESGYQAVPPTQPVNTTTEITTPSSVVNNSSTEEGVEDRVVGSPTEPPEKKLRLECWEIAGYSYAEDDCDNGSFSNHGGGGTDDPNRVKMTELRRILLEPVSDHELKLLNQKMIYTHQYNKQLFFCALCTAKLNTSELVVKHLEGMEHDRRAKMYINWSKDRESHPYFCEVCVASCMCEPMMDDHLTGKKHAKTLSQIHNLKRGDYVPVSPQLLSRLMNGPPVLKVGNGISLGLSPTMMRFFNLPGPFIGLKYAEEIGVDGDPNPRYFCHICKTHMDWNNIGLHFTSTAHRHNVLDYPQLLISSPRSNAKKDTERCAMLAAEVEAHEGRKVELIMRKILKEDVMNVSATGGSVWRERTSFRERDQGRGRGRDQGRGRGRGGYGAWSSDSSQGGRSNLRGHGGFCGSRGGKGGFGRGEHGDFGQGRGSMGGYGQGNQRGSVQRGRGAIGQGNRGRFGDHGGRGRSRGVQGGRGKRQNWSLSQAYGGSSNYGNQGNNDGQNPGSNIGFETDDVSDSYWMDNVERNDGSQVKSENEFWDTPNQQQGQSLSWRSQQAVRIRGRGRERGMGRVNVYSQEVQRGMDRVSVYSQEHIENHFSIQPLVTTPPQMTILTQTHPRPSPQQLTTPPQMTILTQTHPRPSPQQLTTPPQMTILTQTHPRPSPQQFASISPQVHAQYPVTVLSPPAIHKEQPPIKQGPSKADIFKNLAMSSIDSEEDAEMALQLSSTLTHALLAYRIKNATTTNPLCEVLSVVQKASLPGPTLSTMQ